MAVNSYAAKKKLGLLAIMFSLIYLSPPALSVELGPDTMIRPSNGAGWYNNTEIFRNITNMSVYPSNVTFDFEFAVDIMNETHPLVSDCVHGCSLEATNNSQNITIDPARRLEIQWMRTERGEEAHREGPTITNMAARVTRPAQLSIRYIIGKIMAFWNWVFGK